MDMISVESSNLVSVGYNYSSSQLKIIFRDSIYVYNHVPKMVFDSLLRASSKGKYHAEHIVNKFPFQRIR